MRLYSFIIAVSMMLIAVLNTAFGANAQYAAFATVVGTLFVMEIDVVFALAVKLLPAGWFTPDRDCFAMGKRTKKFMHKLGIKKWKRNVPDLSTMVGFFAKRRLAAPHNSEYLRRYLCESAYGQVMHVVVAVVGFTVVFIFPLNIWYRYALPIALVNALLNMMSLAVLRYNYGRVKTAYMFVSRHRKGNG